MLRPLSIFSIRSAETKPSSSPAASRLSEQLRTHEMHREYRAVVRGSAPQEGQLEHFLLQQGAFVHAVPEGTPEAKRARLRFWKLEEKNGLSLVKIQLETGRKHQIRVQMAQAGFPLWGDARYGGGKPGEQIALWGARLHLTHPTLKEPICLTSHPPQTEPWKQFSMFDL